MSIQNLIAKMIETAKSANLPASYQSDIEADTRYLETYQSKDFVAESAQLIWLLRPTGTILAPVGLGVDPVHVTYWLWSEQGAQVKAYLIKLSGEIELISHEEAERLIMLPPEHLSSLMKKSDVTQKVKSVLKKGLELQIWGIFNPGPKSSSTEPSNFCEWLAFFNSSSNRLMQSFMGKAMRLIKAD